MIATRKDRYGRFLLAVLTVVLAAVWISGQPTHAEYADVIFNKRAEKEGMRPVIYSHWFHRIRFRCKVCHHELGFKMRATANDVRMLDLVEGRYCGTCHNNEVAWGIENCDLCHSGKPGLKSGIVGGDRTSGPGRW